MTDVTQHQWHFLKTTLLNEEQVGPVSESEIKQIAASGGLKASTVVMSPTRTRGQWIEVSKVKGLLQLVERGNEKRQQDKQIAKELKAAERQRQKELKQVAPVVNSESSNVSSSEVKIRKQVGQYLTNGEEIEFVVTQAKPVAIKADSVVVTNRRLMIVRPKMLGRLDFSDMLWRDLQDAHITENLIGATFSMKNAKDGSMVSIELLPKRGARRLYQIAQEREEQAEEVRRFRQMEEKAAGATQVNVAAQTAVAAPAPQNQSAADPMERLKKLKQMLEQELISQEDFDQRKAQILIET